MVGCGRRDEGARGRSASADETIIQPRMRRREVGNSATFGALTGHAAGLLGDGALGDCVQAAGQRGGGAENTGHGLAAEVRSLPSVTEEGGKTEKTTIGSIPQHLCAAHQSVKNDLTQNEGECP